MSKIAIPAQAQEPLTDADTTLIVTEMLMNGVQSEPCGCLQYTPGIWILPQDLRYQYREAWASWSGELSCKHQLWVYNGPR